MEREKFLSSASDSGSSYSRIALQDIERKINGILDALEYLNPSKYKRLSNVSISAVRGGIIVYPSAISVGFAPITPTAELMKELSTYTTYTDPATGLTMEYRAWGNADTDSSKEVIECNYGFNWTEKAALKRIVSTT